MTRTRTPRPDRSAHRQGELLAAVKVASDDPAVQRELAARFAARYSCSQADINAAQALVRVRERTG